MKNQIINGCFRVAQRGTSFTNLASGSYHLDRWLLGYTGTVNSTLSQQTFTVGQTDVPGEPTNYMRWVFNSGTTGSAPYLAQRKESVRWGANQPVTFTFYAKISTAQAITVKATQNFGTAGSSSVTNTVGNFNLTTTFQKFTCIFTPPSVSGKTINANNYLEMGIYLPSGTPATGLTLEIANVQLEIGSYATSFEDRTFGEEAELCKRYFHKSYNIDVNPGTASYPVGYAQAYGMYGQSYALFNYDLPVTMRVAPTLLCYSASSGAAGYAYDSSVGDRAVVNGVASTSHLQIGVYATYGGATSIHYTASAEL